MKRKQILIYIILFALIFIAVSIYTCFQSWQIKDDDALFAVMTAVTLPAAVSLVSLWSSNGFRSFRRDATGVVSAAILLLFSQIGTCLAYFFVYKENPSDRIWFYAGGMAVAALLMLALHDTVRKQQHIVEDKPLFSKICQSIMYGAWVASLLLFISLST